MNNMDMNKTLLRFFFSVMSNIYQATANLPSSCFQPIMLPTWDSGSSINGSSPSNGQRDYGKGHAKVREINGLGHIFGTPSKA